MSYGATDDFGYQAVHNRTHVHDPHATMLHLVGIDHEKLTYRHSGRDFRLTDVHGKVISGSGLIDELMQTMSHLFIHSNLYAFSAEYSYTVNVDLKDVSLIIAKRMWNVIMR